MLRNLHNSILLVPILLILTGLLSSCALLTPKPREIEIKTVEIKRAPLSIKTDYPLELDQIEWVIVTEENSKMVFEDLEKKKYDPAIFGLTDKGYESLTVNNSKILALIEQYKAIISAYQKYYETPEVISPPLE